MLIACRRSAADSDSVSVINTVTDTVAKTIHVGGTGRGRETLLGSKIGRAEVATDPVGVDAADVSLP